MARVDSMRGWRATAPGVLLVLGALLHGCGDDDTPPTVTAAGASGGTGAAGASGGTAAGASGGLAVAGMLGGSSAAGTGGADAAGSAAEASVAGMAGMQQATGGTSAQPSADACGGDPAMLNDDGVPTSHPGISMTLLPSTLTAESLSFVVDEDGDPRGPLLSMFVELRNDGSSIACRFIPDISLDGEELVGLVETPPYHEHVLDTVFSTVSDCLDTGETGVLMAVARGISEADLQAAYSLFIDATPQGDTTGTTDYLPATEEPLLDAQVVPTADGYALGGTVTPVSPIFNYGLTVYPRDGRGLLFAELRAYPGELEPIAAGVATDFESEAAPCQFTDYLSYQSWIRDEP